MSFALLRLRCMCNMCCMCSFPSSVCRSFSLCVILSLCASVCHLIYYKMCTCLYENYLLTYLHKIGHKVAHCVGKLIFYTHTNTHVTVCVWTVLPIHHSYRGHQTSNPPIHTHTHTHIRVCAHSTSFLFVPGISNNN